MATSARAQNEAFDREFRRWAQQFYRQNKTAIERFKDRVSVRELEEAIETGSVARVLQTIDATGLSDEMAAQGVHQTFQSTFATGAELGRVALGAELAAASAGTFDLLDPRSVDFLRRHKARYIREINTSTQEAINDVIIRAFEQGGGPRQTGRYIRDSIGLTKAQSRAVFNFRAQLEGTATDEQLRRWTPADQRRLSAAERQMVRSQLRRRTMSQARINALVKTYEQRLINLRAETIARTETLRALNEGQNEQWQQAAAEGYLDDETTRRFWVTAGDSRVRDAHASIPNENPQGVRLNEPFKTIGGPTMMPPPFWSPFNCRCRVILRDMRLNSQPDKPTDPTPSPIPGADARRDKPKPKPKPRAKPKPKPAPVTPAAPSPRFKYQEFEGFDSLEEAEGAIKANLAAVTGFLPASKLDAIGDAYKGALEVTERFGLGKMLFWGNTSKAPLRTIARKRISIAAYTPSGIRNPSNPEWEGKRGLMIFSGKALNRQAHRESMNPAKYKKNLPERHQAHYARHKAETDAAADHVMERSQFVIPEVKDRWKKYRASGGSVDWTVGDEVIQTAHHEMGHRLHFMFREEIDKIMVRDRNVLREGWGYLISEYGRSNHFEYVAEAFSLYMQGDASQFYRIHPELLKWFQTKDKLK